MTLAKFDPPGLLEDFNDQQKTAWSEWISDQMDEAAMGFPDVFDFDGPREQFYNPIKVETGPDAQSVDISWTAFPKNVFISSVSDLQRWRIADGSRDVQDEYCEWSVERDPISDKITRVTFTCEGPEYWQFLAETTPQVALDLYRKFVNLNVEMSDLFSPSGRYNRRNKWNASTTRGAMHLIQAANTLSAEIELAGGSSVVRVINSRTLTEEQELIRCGQYGDPNRNSDPHIGAMVNSLSRRRAAVTLANPVGLYFSDLLTAGWQTPDGSDPKSYWSYVRGVDGRAIRAVYEIPMGVGFVVGDVTINGRPIEFGAQIADFITIKLTGIATRFDQSTAAPVTGCRVRKPAAVRAFAAPLSVNSTLSPEQYASR
jgi:hypothetical protein